MKSRITVYIRDTDNDRLDRLMETYGLGASAAMRAGLALLEQKLSPERKEKEMTSAELFDRFTGGQVTTADVAAMDLKDIERQVAEFRAEGWLEDLPASDTFLAEKLHRYAAQDN